MSRSVVRSDAVFVGWQKTSWGEMFALYNITAAHHPSRGSTVTDETLRRLSLHIPATPEPPARLPQAENTPTRFWKKIESEANIREQPDLFSIEHSPAR